MKKIIGKIVLAILGTAGSFALVAPTTAYASWHGDCTPYHNGDICFYTGYNGTGSKSEIPEDSMDSFAGICLNVGVWPGWYDNDWESVQSTYQHFEVDMWNSQGCPTVVPDDVMLPNDPNPIRNLKNDDSPNPPHSTEDNKISAITFVRLYPT